MNGPPCAFRTAHILHLLVVVFRIRYIRPPPLSPSILREIPLVEEQHPWPVRLHKASFECFTASRFAWVVMREEHVGAKQRSRCGRCRAQENALWRRSFARRLNSPLLFFLPFIATSSVGKSPHRHLLFFSWRVVTRRPF